LEVCEIKEVVERVVAVEEVPYPTFVVDRGDWKGRQCNHGVIIKPITSAICGSDMHMVRGRAGATPGMQLGHEFTGEIVSVGPDVEYLQIGDWVSCPFNVCCGRCKNCKEMKYNSCLNVNKLIPGGAYGYVMQGDWPGGQAEYVLVPYADFNCLKIPKNAASEERLLDLAFLTDILPTGYHGAVTAGVTTGSTVYIAGAGPVGLACAASCLQLLGASTVVISDYNESRLKLASKMGCETIHITDKDPLAGITTKIRALVLGKQSIPDMIESILGDKFVDCAIDCAGFETNGHGACRHSTDQRSEVINDLLDVTTACGGISVPGVYLPLDTGADDTLGKTGGLALKFGNGWAKHFTMATGQCPTMRYNRQLMQAILADRIKLAEYINTTVISLDEAPKAYKIFNEGAPRKFVIDPHGMVPERAKTHARALRLDDQV